MTPRVRGTGQFPAQGLYLSWGVREPRARTRRRDGVRGWGRQGVCAAHPPRSPWKWTLVVTGGHGRPPSQKEPKKPPVQTEGPGGDPMALSVQDGLSKGCRERAPPSHPSLRASGPGSLGDQAVTCQAGRKPQVGCLGIREAPGPAFQRRSPRPAPTSSPCPAHAHHHTCIFLPGAVLLEQVGGNKTDGQRSVWTPGHHGPQDLTLPLGPQR